MYKVTLNDTTILYHSNLEMLKLKDAKITLEVNKAGSFKFLIYPTHPYYALITKLKSYIKVYKNEKIIFSGRVIEDDLGFYNEKHVYCEGELAYFNDSVQRSYEFQGTITELLTLFITEHNAQVEVDKQFTLGVVTVTDANDYMARASTEFKKTLVNLNDKLISTYGGYMYVRNENNVRYLDYLEDFDTRSAQSIEFGKNLLDYAKKTTASDIVTAIIPLGAETEVDGVKTKLDIKSVNGGLDYVFNQDAVDLYGWIFEKVEWQDVTLPANLKTKATDYLLESMKLNITIELKALDLSAMDKNIDDFSFCEYVEVISVPHGLNEFMLIQKQDIDILNESNNTITLGTARKSFTEQTVKDQNDTKDYVKVTTESVSNYILNKLMESENHFSSSINQSATNILQTVASEYITPSGVDTKVSTAIEQKDTEYSIKFNSYEEFQTATGVKFTDMQKYIRFVNGNIELGNNENALTLKITNEKIVFLNGMKELAYFQNNKLYVTDVELPLGGKLKLGNYAFIPRTNGNLSFKFVG